MRKPGMRNPVLAVTLQKHNKKKNLSQNIFVTAFVTAGAENKPTLYHRRCHGQKSSDRRRIWPAGTWCPPLPAPVLIPSCSAWPAPTERLWAITLSLPPALCLSPSAKPLSQGQPADARDPLIHEKLPVQSKNLIAAVVRFDVR